MKLYLLPVFLLFISLSVFSQDYKESELPPNIVSNFKDKFTPQGKVSWNKNNDIFTASFKSDDQNVKASFANDGKWVDTKYDIGYKELPGSVVTYVTSNFRDAKIKESSMRDTPSESEHYYIVLKKDGITDEAILYFDLKGNFIKQSVPESFYKSTGTGKVAVSVPPAVFNAFKTKYPDAALESWKTDSTLYTASFTSEEMKGKAEFTLDGTWHFTKYPIDGKELPGPVVTDLKQNYSEYKVKTSEMVEEPGTTSYYYILIKKEGIGQPSIELYYTLTGKLIKKVASEEKAITNDTEKADNAVKTASTTANTTTAAGTTKSETEGTSTTTSDNADEITNSVEKISTKELPSPIITYIKKEYQGYVIKEAVLSTTDDGTFYYVKIRKEGLKPVTELQFDISGKFVEPKNE
jgi:hypothetical protein